MDTPTRPGLYGRSHRALEIVSIALLFVTLTWAAARITSAVGSSTELLWVGVAALAGFVCSDFLSGLVHWAGDTIGDENTPIFGPNFVRPFRHHHVDPEEITRHDFIETNGNNCIAAAPAMLFLWLFLPDSTGLLFYGCVLLASTTWFVFCTNQFHKWAHTPRPARWIRALQRAGLILSPEHHAIHHAVPQDKYYCITVGWMNPILHRLGFFRICETIVQRIYPRALNPDRQAS